MMKKQFIRTASCSIALILCAWIFCFFSTAPWIHPVRSYALDDDEFSGYKAEKLSIEVGYFGGPFYPKAEFTIDQLRAMGTVKADYTFIDNMPSVVIDHVEGVRLADVMDAAGIDINSIQSFNFWTNDKSDGYYTSLTKSELLDTPRYCYYSLQENFDDISGAGNSHAADVKERVDTVIALGDDWNRCIAGGTFGSDYMNLNTNTRFRLIFGQTDTYTRTANSSAKWIHKIVVVLGGTPTVTLGDTNLEGKVGSVLHTVASVKTADSAISESASVKWSSSDESIASVDENGNITIKGEGSAVITASFGGASAQLTINGTPGEEESGGGGLQNSDGSDGLENSENSSPNSSDVREGEVTNPVPSKVISAAQVGGVQNWRVYEMAADAQPLAPQEDKDNPMLPVMGCGSAALLAAGIVGRGLKFRRDLIGKKQEEMI